MELRNTLYVVVVAVGEDRRNDRPEVDACGAAALQKLAAAEAAVYEKDRATRLGAIRVSCAAAREGDDPHPSPPSAARLFLME